MVDEWNGMSTDEKLEALRDDVNSALDSIDDVNRDLDKMNKSIKTLESTMKRLAEDVYELKKKL